MRLFNSFLVPFLILIIVPYFARGQELLPASTTGEIIRHTYYTLSYSEKNEQAEWVYYELTPSLIKGGQKRTDDYRPDESVPTISAQLEDYRGSGYDRGHLCPAGDMKLNLTAMSESFYLSNMSPQDRDFNAGIWNVLEDQVRRWAFVKGKIYVVTAGVLTSDMGSIGANRVTVPKYYYKIIYDPAGQGNMIAFLMPNVNSSLPLRNFMVSVDYVENLTGLDFFPDLPDSTENLLEQEVNRNAWGL
jgi:endonuclease G